jgi:hypothetical protein
MSQSIVHRAYYAMKPHVPRRMRYAVRRVLARRTLARTTAWPIKPGTEVPPSNWSGWPEGRPFAFVLTHDVEGQSGLNRCLQLAELEAGLGFRSSFNFVPEGEYRVPADLRVELARRGFEVGVHDLHHDGSLYRSHEDFVSQSARINHYLEEWGAVGFRAGFMFHNLNWLLRLKVSYDASTFDVDPFEPQPDGVNTIFPFWVEDASGGGGYVELPYTLVQDSTLFLVLRQRSIQKWKDKLDWVAQHGGMVLVNVHPDYIGFGRSDSSWDEYPATYYSELLEYVRKEYAGRYWQALPRAVADYCFQCKPKLTSSPGMSLSARHP